jgi:hypothetical protein
LSPEKGDYARSISQGIKSGIKTKQDVFDISYRGVSIGVAIYESYLQMCRRPTADLEDPRLYDYIDEGIRTAVFWDDYLERHAVRAIVISHDCNIPEDVLARIAYERKIPVYLADCLRLRNADRPYSYATHFTDYRKMFDSFSEEEKEKAVRLAKNQLERRFCGEVAVDMVYSTESAFVRSDDEAPVLRQNDKIKILIATHCFFDNPHGYGGMLFLDFYEWLMHLGEISKQTDYDWYIKTHPNYLPGTMEIITEILDKYPHIQLIPSKVSHHQLVEEGIDFVVTVYGTVGHEYPALGVPVINAGYNPRIAYDFNYHPKSIEEYDNVLLNLDKLHIEMDKQQIYEFYYMQHYYAFIDDLVLESHRKYVQDVGLRSVGGPEMYSYFIDQLTDSRHHQIIDRFSEFVESGRRNYFELRKSLDFG